MKCIIIEDQPPAQRIIQKYIKDIGTLDLCGTFADALQALEFIKMNEVQLMFLDIHLPKLSGIDFLKTLNNPPYVILTTAFADYALESYDLEVVDYLLKPFSFPRFVKAIGRVEERVSGLPNPSLNETDPKEIFIKTGFEHIKIQVVDIRYIHSDSDYTELITDHKIYLSSESLRHWSDRIDNFVQVHKSYIINKAHIDKVSSNRVFLGGDHVVPIGRAYKDDFIKSIS